MACEGAWHAGTCFSVIDVPALDVSVFIFFKCPTAEQTGLAHRASRLWLTRLGEGGVKSSLATCFRTLSRSHRS